tara:strand:- start:3200 stop:3886 length:687 start_codon:yes stop_codon:yes gene_type:complete
MNLEKIAFRWSPNLWSTALKGTECYHQLLTQKKMRILEIGASSSIVSLMFDVTQSDIKVGCWQKKQMSEATSALKDLSNLQSKYTVAQVDAFEIVGKFDVIIMKSVLGGLFRTHNSTLDECELYIKSLLKNNINEGGVFITIDNGKHMAEKLLKSIGILKTRWRRFSIQDLSFADNKGFAGAILTVGSLTYRIYIIGFFIDKLLFNLDCLLMKLLPKHPNVICSVFKK